jgi:hypothetical protein
MYDLGQFGASIVLDALRTHPLVILAGSIRENAFYVPPEQFLEELRQRHEGAIG